MKSGKKAEESGEFEQLEIFDERIKQLGAIIKKNKHEQSEAQRRRSEILRKNESRLRIILSSYFVADKKRLDVVFRNDNGFFNGFSDFLLQDKNFSLSLGSYLLADKKRFESVIRDSSFQAFLSGKDRDFLRIAIDRGLTPIKFQKGEPEKHDTASPSEPEPKLQVPQAPVSVQVKPPVQAAKPPASPPPPAAVPAV